MKEASKYDVVVKDLFQQDHPSLLDKLTGGVAVKEVLNVELARVEERRADLVLSLADGPILHLEFQSTNDRDMPYREGIYCLLLGQKYRRRVRRVVLYVGQPRMRMKDYVQLGETRYSYSLLDIRELDARELMASGRPGDLALAMLAGGGEKQVFAIAKLASELTGRERRRALSQLLLLSGLRRLTGTLTMELKAMDVTRDITKNEFIQEIVQNTLREELANLLQGQLEAKFGRLPKWVGGRLQAATSVQVKRWFIKFASADSLEGVLGKK
ncbi:MAG: hypothetical protein ABJF23_03505 [Bryobacteraceae bacterium]